MGALVKIGRAVIALPKGDKPQPKTEEDPNSYNSYNSYTSYPRETRIAAAVSLPHFTVMHPPGGLASRGCVGYDVSRNPTARGEISAIRNPKL